MKILFRL